MTYLEEYHELIRKGDVVVDYWIKKEIQNLIEDLDNPAYIYDTSEAHKRIKFMQTMATQSKQPYYNKPLQLMPFQLAFLEALYSFKMAATLATRFGGTWVALLDRYEWDEDTYTQFVGTGTATVLRAHLSSTGIVNVTLGGNADATRVQALYLPRKYRQSNLYGTPEGQTIWIGSMNAEGSAAGAIGFPTYENTAEQVYLQVYQTITNACFNGSWDAGIPADRTFKRFKRTA